MRCLTVLLVLVGLAGHHQSDARFATAGAVHVGGTRINRGGRKLLIDGEAPTTTPAVKDTESSNGSGDGGGGAAVAPASTSNGAAGEVAHDPQACSEYSLMDCLDGERDDDLPLKCPVLCGTNNNPAPVTSATSTSGTEELDGGDSYGCVPVAAYAGDETIVQLCTSMETACDTQAIFCIYLPPPSTTSTVTTVTTVTTVAAVKAGCVRAEKYKDDPNMIAICDDGSDTAEKCAETTPKKMFCTFITAETSLNKTAAPTAAATTTITAATTTINTTTIATTTTTINTTTIATTTTINTTTIAATTTISTTTTTIATTTTTINTTTIAATTTINTTTIAATTDATVYMCVPVANYSGDPDIITACKSIEKTSKSAGLVVGWGCTSKPAFCELRAESTLEPAPTPAPTSGTTPAPTPAAVTCSGVIKKGKCKQLLGACEWDGKSSVCRPSGIPANITSAPTSSSSRAPPATATTTTTTMKTTHAPWKCFGVPDPAYCQTVGLEQCGKTDYSIGNVLLTSVSRQCPGLCDNCPQAPPDVTTSDAPSTTSIACANKEAHCGDWFISGECERNPKYMELQCPRACGLCSSLPTKVTTTRSAEPSTPEPVSSVWTSIRTTATFTTATATTTERPGVADCALHSIDMCYDDPGCQWSSRLKVCGDMPRDGDSQCQDNPLGYTDQFGQSCPYIVGSGYLCDELPENKAACCGCGGGLQGMLVPGGPPLGNESSGDQTGYNLKAAKAYSVVVVACAAFVCLATVISYGRSWKNNKMGKLSPQKKRALQERLYSGQDAYGMETMSPFEIDSYDSDEADDLVFITN